MVLLLTPSSRVMTLLWSLLLPKFQNIKLMFVNVSVMIRRFRRECRFRRVNILKTHKASLCKNSRNLLLFVSGSRPTKSQFTFPVVRVPRLRRLKTRRCSQRLKLIKPRAVLVTIKRTRGPPFSELVKVVKISGLIFRTPRPLTFRVSVFMKFILVVRCPGRIPSRGRSQCVRRSSAWARCRKRRLLTRVPAAKMNRVVTVQPLLLTLPSLIPFVLLLLFIPFILVKFLKFVLTQ